MVKHLVMFKLKDQSKGSIQKAAEIIRDMEGKIPELKYIEVGIDFVNSDRSYDLALITHFEDKAGLEIYRTHPVHVPVLDYLREVTEDVIVVDYEI